MRGAEEALEPVRGEDELTRMTTGAGVPVYLMGGAF